MIIEKEERYYRICDECGKRKEISKQWFKKLSNKKNSINYCLSCNQLGERNRMYSKNPWNKGLTSDTDIRVKLYNEKQKITKKENPKSAWNKGSAYETLKGAVWSKIFRNKVSKTKKGISNIKNRNPKMFSKSARDFRKRIRSILYINFVFPVMERDGFTCQKCGRTDNLEVHHVNESFSEILKKSSLEMNLDLNDYKNWSDSLYCEFREIVIKNHNIENGITFCIDCHGEEDKWRKKFLKI